MPTVIKLSEKFYQKLDRFFLEACRRYLSWRPLNYAQDILTRAAQEALRVGDGSANVSPPSGPSCHAGSSSFNRGGEGHEGAAPEGQMKGALPVREPTASQIAAAASVANVIAITVLDSFKVRDGRSIGDVRYGEIERLHGVNAREAHVLYAIKRHVAHAGHDEKIRHIVKARDLERFIQQAAELSDAR